MTIRAVFRVQCDMCKGWLSWSEDYVPGTPVLPEHSEVLPTAERAWLWPGERAARTAALAAGWVRSYSGAKDRNNPRWLCPKDKLNPLGIVLPRWTGREADR